MSASSTTVAKERIIRRIKAERTRLEASGGVEELVDMYDGPDGVAKHPLEKVLKVTVLNLLGGAVATVGPHALGHVPLLDEDTIHKSLEAVGDVAREAIGELVDVVTKKRAVLDALPEPKRQWVFAVIALVIASAYRREPGIVHPPRELFSSPLPAGKRGVLLEGIVSRVGRGLLSHAVSDTVLAHVLTLAYRAVSAQAQAWGAIDTMTRGLSKLAAERSGSSPLLGGVQALLQDGLSTFPRVRPVSLDTLKQPRLIRGGSYMDDPDAWKPPTRQASRPWLPPVPDPVPEPLPLPLRRSHRSRSGSVGSSLGISGMFDEAEAAASAPAPLRRSRSIREDLDGIAVDKGRRASSSQGFSIY